MQLFKKRETPVQNIAYLSIMAAVNVIFVLLSALLPALMFLLIFILPLASAVVTIYCQKRYFPIYFIVTIGLCMLASFGIYIFDTFCYVLPALISGFFFGLMIEKNVPAIYIIGGVSIIQYILSFITFITIKALFPNINFVSRLLGIFGLSDFPYKEVFIHSFLFVIASIQTVFCHVIIENQLKKLQIFVNHTAKTAWIMFAVNILFICLSFLMSILYIPLTYVFVFANMVFIVYEVCYLILLNNVKIYVALSLSLIVSCLIFALCYSLLPHPLGIILVNPFFFFIAVIYFMNYLFINKNNHNKI